MPKSKLKSEKGFANIILVIIGVLVLAGVGVGYWAVKRQKAEVPPANQVFCTQDAKECPDGSFVGRIGPNCEFAGCPPGVGETEDGSASSPQDWKTYIYSSTESKIFPSILFKYPVSLGDAPTLISSRATNPPGIFSEDWGGFVEFSPTGVLAGGLRLEFVKLDRSRNSLENILKSVPVDEAAKEFTVDGYRIVRKRFVSSSHYDADVGWYFVELPQYILHISTSGNKQLLYDDDQNGFSTRDKIISTLQLIP